MTPTIGRIVIAAVDPMINNGSAECPAVITRVWSDNMVNVRLLRDSAVEDLQKDWRTSVYLYDERPEAPMVNINVWWPPRV